MARPEAADSPDQSGKEAASRFNPATAGTIRGRVSWQGDVPQVPRFEERLNLPPDTPPQPRVVRENPNAPVVDPKTGGVAHAVVFLRGVDPRLARPWDHPLVCVEQRDKRLHVVQGKTIGRVGFVRTGEAVEMVSRETVFHVLHASGAAYFTLTFPDAEQPLRRPFRKKGLVELSSAAGYYWMRAYLFVDDHPYYTQTDEQGRFVLEQVPPGKYEVVCWLPNWKKERHERDPESGLITRLFLGPPAEKAGQVDLRTGESSVIDFVFWAANFQGRLSD
jgi:hypothetical protein